MHAHDPFRNPVTNTPHAVRSPLRLSLIGLLAVAGLLAGCTDLPGVRLMDSENYPHEALTIDVGETVEIIARTSGNGNFPLAYGWKSSDDSVIRVTNRVELGGTAQRVDVTGLKTGTSTLYFGNYSTVDGTPISGRSDSIVFTVVETVTEFPSLNLEAAGSLNWKTSPEADLSSFDSLRIQATFTVNDIEIEGSPLSLVFEGDADQVSATDVVQLTSDPSGTTLSATFADFPEAGTYVAGDTLSWDIVVDLSTWGDDDTAIVFRPETTENGTILPALITLSSSDISQVE